MNRCESRAFGLGDIWQTKLDWPSVVVLGAAFFWLGYLFFPNSAEDAYIVARYVNNLLAGKGLVYNEGERINALTSPAHVFLLAGLRYLTSDVVLAYKAIMIVAVPAILLRVGIRVIRNTWDILFYLSVALLSPFVVLWTAGGMETPILLLVLSAISGLILPSDRSLTSRTVVWVIGLSAVSFLIRYDSAVFLLPIVSKLLWDHRRSSAVWISFAVFSLAVLVWFSFTLIYYHDLLPTSFYTKSPLSQNPQSLIKGFIYLTSFLVCSLVFFLLFSKRPSTGTRIPSLTKFDGTATMVWIGLFLFGGYAILAGTKHMMYAYRLYVPFIPTLMLVLLKSDSAWVPTNLRANRFLFLAIVGYQCALGYVVNEFSLNPNVMLLIRRQDPYNEYFEFSTLGGKYNIEALRIYHQGAVETQEHWRSTGANADSIPRMYILPGGMLPYSYPELYVYETLASYRHHCVYDFKRTAHYVHLVYPAEKEETPSLVFGDEWPKWHRVSSHVLVARGITERFPLRFEIYFQEAPSRNKLPPRIDQPCLE